MARISDMLRGYARVRAQGAEPARILDLCVLRGIEFWAAAPEDELCIELNIRLYEVSRFLELAQESRCELSLVKKRGAPLKLLQARRRAVLWVLPAALLAVLVAASMFTWKIDISGNKLVTEAEIRNALEESGVYIGSFHPSYTSDSIRSLVMVQIPEIKWISVRVYGSRADVLVRERTEIPEVYDKREPTNVVASAPGIIEQLRAFSGKPRFIRGQTVAKGDLLISGTVPSTFSPGIITHARGEVIARTWHEVTVVMPKTCAEKKPVGSSSTRWTLKLGDNRIKFHSGSGIWGAKCDNIIREHRLGIEGLFELPVSLISETSLPYECSASAVDKKHARAVLEKAALAQLEDRIGEEGEILNQSFSISESGDCLVLTLLAECRQDIAREKPMTADEISQAKLENTTPEDSTNQ